MAAALEQPKKPVGGAFGMFMAEKRPEYLKALEGKRASEVSKKGGEAWKQLSDEQKAPYQKKYEAAKAKYDKDMAVFLEAGGEKTKVKRKAKDKNKEKKLKDVNEPKKPAGGGYGVFLAEKREAITKSLPAGHKITDVAKEASKQWKELPDAAKKTYQETFIKKQEEYKAAMANFLFQKSLTQDAEEDGKENKAVEESPKSKSPKKRKRATAGDAGSSPPEKKAKVTPPKVKKSTKVGKNGKPQLPDIDADVLKKAESLGLDGALKNLVSRADVMAKEFPHAKLLNALKENEGLVNKTKYALLGA